MLFQEVVGQQNIKKRLIKAVENKTIAHAQLFSGVEGCGTLPLALAYAQYILCTNRTGEDSCGVCPSCQKVKVHMHPDLHYIYPIVKGKLQNPICENFIKEWRSQLTKDYYFGLQDWYSHINAENAQGSIYSAESVEIVRKMQMKPFEAEYKVMIIWMPELMNETCSNKLLKLFEEPPQNTIFLLVAESIARIIPTILSRVQHTNVPPLSMFDVSEYLSKEKSLDNEAINRYSRLSEGSIIKARNLVETSQRDTYFLNSFTTLMRQAYLRNIVELKLWTETVVSLGREEQKYFLSYAQRMVRENFILNINQKEDINFLNPEELSFSSRFSKFINEKNVIPIMEELNLAQIHVEKNVNAKMIFFDLCLKIIMLLKN